MTTRPTEFTGRHMLSIILAFFGVIIAVNVTMATFATTSWSGLVVKNSYVASQQFNDKAQLGRAQAALGWTGTLAIDGATLRYSLADREGQAVPLAAASVTFRRPTSESEDRTFALAADPQGWHAAAADLQDGVWIVEVAADAMLEQPYRDVRRVMLRDGALR
jgi:nitrogen fixation protein FixH